MRWLIKLNHSPFYTKLRFSSSVTCAYLLPHLHLEALQLYDAGLYATTVASETIIDTDLETNHDISQDMTMITVWNRSDPEHTKFHLQVSIGAFCISYTLRWRHNGRDGVKSPASPLFTQPFIRSQIKENIKAPRHWPLRGEFTGDHWIPRTNGQ